MYILTNVGLLFTVATYELLCLKNAGAQISLDSTANPAHLPRKWTKWAKLALLFS